MNTQKIFSIVKLLVFGFVLSVGLSYVHAAWTDPTGTAPANNIAVPVNATTNSQVKVGNLSVNTFAALGNGILEQQAFFRNTIKGLQPGSTDPTLYIGGTPSTGGATQRVTTNVNGDINSGKTIGATDLINSNLNPICGSVDGHYVFCDYTEPDPDPVPGGGTTFATCFIADTHVTLADGSKKNIQDIKIGDVLKGDTTNNTVLAFHRPPLGDGKIYAFNGGRAFVTAEHPFMTTKGWKSIDPEKTKKENIGITVTPLHIGDTLITDAGLVKIASIQEKSEPKDTPLYNFVLSGDRTYFADGYLVHNKNACSASSSGPQCPAPTFCIGDDGYVLPPGSATGNCSTACIQGQPLPTAVDCPAGKTMSCSTGGEVICN